MERPFCTSCLPKFCIKDWPEPKSVAFLETLAKYDIDAAVQLILCREKFIVKDVYKYLDYQDMLTIRRRELVYRKWAFNVRDPLRRKISEKVSPAHAVTQRKQEKPGSCLKRSNKMVTLPPFRDPLLQAQQDRDEENRAILQCETGKIYTMKEFKEVKAKWLGTLPPFSFGWQDRRPNSGLVGEENCQKSSARAKPGSAGRIRLPSRKYSPVLKRRSEGAREKVVDLVLGISGLTLAAWSTVDQDKAGSYKAAEAWAHRPAPLRSATRPASQKLHCMYLEKPAHPCTGPGPSHNMRRSAWVPSALS